MLCLSRSFKALACLVLLPAAALANKHIKCESGDVAYKTMKIGGQEVDVLTSGPGCPESELKGMPLPVPEAVEIAAPEVEAPEPESAALVEDSPHRTSQMGTASATTHSAGEAVPSMLPWLLAGLLLMVVAGAFAGSRLYDQKVRQPRLLSEAQRKAEEDEQMALREAEEGARLAAEEEEERRLAQEEEAERRAREEAERLAKEGADRRLREQEQERAKRQAERERRAKEEEDLLAKEAAAEERRRRELEEADERAKAAAAQKAAEEAAKKGCCGCASKPKAAEPATASGSQR